MLFVDFGVLLFGLVGFGLGWLIYVLLDVLLGWLIGLMLVFGLFCFVCDFDFWFCVYVLLLDILCL